jgi:oligoendopeptidase F
MFNTLPASALEFADWSWAQIQPYYTDLQNRPLTADTVNAWLADWTGLEQRLQEAVTRMSIATTLDTTDTAAVTRYHTFLQNIVEPAQVTENALREKLLASGLKPDGFEIPLRNMHNEAELFCEANIPLSTQEQKLSNEYQAVIGAQSVQWEGEEKTLAQLKPLFQSDDRALRERVWRAISERHLADRPRLNELWQQFMSLRKQQATNAGFGDFRSYRWRQFARFDYSPADCETFHAAIEKVVVPAATRVYERQKKLLGVDSLRPWDLDRDDTYPPSRPPLKPFTNVQDLIDKTGVILHQVDPELGAYYDIMKAEGLLDLENRKGKAPGGYQSSLGFVKRPFIFMNAVGIHDDVRTLLHEAGHAFHWFEASRLPYFQQWNYGAEIAEVASMSMELLAAPYLSEKHGGFYSESEAAQARIGHLEHILLFWPYMSVVDAFQHWVYTHHDQATDPANCDAKWGELWGRFLPALDWNGLEDARVTGWHRKLHIFEIPFYYVDYGLAQMGALQVWRNALSDRPAAIRQYREGLSLGGTRTLPDLFAATGAKFAFDAQTLGGLVDLIESTIRSLKPA